ncbi:uncharacterized protein MYCFIDRAFT_171887 [Pseudocercospora fijiensis CIRAD86]|uniref:Uncharacterized protein n=1 Tax=Pseudocercospora fijiensis (strain CIRAD86) TaxID=383855 RepID=M3B9S7_PSEFD|nr:uncharacterized protein MYCFIDRAFT_171887 [Pseudocercospora fijiensis CIRAD86]EME86082.1 hypothetical protein MYCFIDRAFT_171887 [Pseudocercospora fijiensis CIRAD86]
MKDIIGHIPSLVTQTHVEAASCYEPKCYQSAQCACMHCFCWHEQDIYVQCLSSDKTHIHIHIRS